MNSEYQTPPSRPSYNNISDLGLCYTILDGGNTDRNTNRGLAPTESLIKVRTKLSYNEQLYSKTCVKRPLSKRPKIGFQDQLSLNEGRKYCRMLQGDIMNLQFANMVPV